MKKILITGASGLVGKAIYEELANQKGVYEIICCGNKQFRNIKEKKSGKFLSVDITDKGEVSRLEQIGKVDAVIHSAGLAHQFGTENPGSFQKVNVEGTKNIAELAVKLSVKQFILISSVAVYGNQNKSSDERNEITEECECNPKGAYAESKFEAENLLRKICEKNDIPLVILRLATVIGEEDRGNVLRLIEAVNRRRFVWIGRGTNYKSLIYKAEVARACRLILERKPILRGTEIFNITAPPVQIREVVLEISATLKKSVPQIKISERFLRLNLRIGKSVVPFGKVRRILETLEKWLSDEVFSGKKVAKQVGFVPEISVKEGLKREVGWYLKNKC